VRDKIIWFSVGLDGKLPKELFVVVAYVLLKLQQKGGILGKE
jgi:hypothetical protein